MSSYILQTGAKGKERLEILNEMTNADFLAFLESSGLKPGMIVLDIGCGTGILTCEIGKKVGPSGRVLGIDISQAQIDQARQHPNVEFRQMSAHDIEKLDKQFDLIVTRYVLMHVKEPKLIIQNAVKLLKKGGIMVCDESADAETFFCDPPNVGYELYTKGVKAQMQMQGSDGSIGMKLKQIFTDEGFAPFAANTYTLALITPRQKKLLRLGFEEAGAKVIEAGLFTAAEVETAIEQLRAFEADDRYLAFYNKFMRIAAKKG